MGPKPDSRRADREAAPIQDGLGVQTWAGPWSQRGRQNPQERLLHSRARGPALLENRASQMSLSLQNLVKDATGALSSVRKSSSSRPVLSGCEATERSLLPGRARTEAMTVCCGLSGHWWAALCL